MIFRRKNHQKIGITESFISQFMEEKTVNGSKYRGFSYWRLKSSKYDIQELISFIDRYLDDSNFSFDTQKINNLLNQNNDK